MLTKFTIGVAILTVIQFSFADSPSPTGLAGSIQDARCAQAKQFGLDDLRRSGLVIECN